MTLMPMARSLRILVISPVYPLASTPTEGLFCEAHTRALATAGAEVEVVVVKPWLPDSLARRTSTYKALAGLDRQQHRRGVDITVGRYLHIPQYLWPDLTAVACSRSLLGALRSALGGKAFDVVQVHGAWPGGLAASSIARHLGCPLVVTFHIQDDHRLVSRSRLYPAMLEDAAALVVVGRPLARFLQPFGVQKKIHRIPNGVNLPALPPAPAHVEPWGHIVSVSNLWPTKGIDLNLRALARLQSQGRRFGRYTIVGDGPERPKLEALAKKLGLTDRVVFTGRLVNEKALEQVAAADIFSLPSWQESFGIVYLEAMACGKPVIGCLTQGAADIIRPERDGLLVEPRNVDQLSEALGALLENPDRARVMGRAGAQHARSFTWERCAEQYLDLYHSLLEDQHSFAGSPPLEKCLLL